MKLGVIDVGGGFRDIYGAGVFDWCLDHDVNFDYCIGISAGSANLASYLARQRGRNYTFYMYYVFRKEYASRDTWLKTRNYVDLDYVYSTLSNSDGENPIDYETMAKNPAEFYVGACDARTGQAVYFSKSCLKKDHYDIFKGSCALPMFCKPYRVENIPCLDGGISDPVPARLLAKTYPKAAERLLDRYRLYNDGVEIAKEYQKLGKLLIVAPDDICGLSTLSKSHEKLQMMYDKGMKDAEKIGTFLNCLANNHLRSHRAGRNRRATAKGLELRVAHNLILVDIQEDAHDVAALRVADRADAAGVIDFTHIAGVHEMIHDFFGIHSLFTPLNFLEFRASGDQRAFRSPFGNLRAAKIVF